VTEATAFLWFSMTKIATATAVMKLVDTGAIDPGAPVRERLSDLDGLDRRITARQLLNHSSGIGNPPPLRWIHPAGAPGPDQRELVSRLLRKYGKPRFEPGDRSAYSNIGYLVLGELVSEVSGVSYKRYVVEQVLQPIGADATGFAFDKAAPDRLSEGAHPRRDPAFLVMRLLTPRWTIGPRFGKWRLFNPFYLDGSAYGGLVGTVEDAARLAGLHLNGGAWNGTRILSERSAAEMQRIATPGKKLDLGLGWFRRHRDSKRGRRHVEHLGGGGGYGSVMRLYPERGIAVVAMANVSSSRFKHERLLAPVMDRERV
jgi:CubicO group peptidase (beta-lactamase class C family)